METSEAFERQNHIARAKLSNRMVGTEEHTAINANYHEINRGKRVRDRMNRAKKK